MNRIPIPKVAKLLVELGSKPRETEYDASEPFQLLLVITNGLVQRKFLWITLRKTGIYVAFGGPGSVHTSYHTDGNFHWKVGNIAQDLDRKPPLPNIATPILLQSATAGISNDVLDKFELTEFNDISVDRVIYLDNRKLPNSVYYQIWAVPPFMHGDVPLMIDEPAHVHFCTHTQPWLMAIIYEQGVR